jgi:arsenate reductase
MSVTIYHNPACGTSRNTLAMIRATGAEPTIIEYLKTPPTRDELRDLVQRMGVKLRDILRQKGTPYAELGLDDPTLSDDALLDAIEADHAGHPRAQRAPHAAARRGGIASDAELDLGARRDQCYIRERQTRLPAKGAAMTKGLVDSGLLQSARGGGAADRTAAQPATGREFSDAPSASATEDLTAPIFYMRTTGVDVWPRWLSFGRRSRD